MDSELQRRILVQLELMNTNLADIKEMIRGFYREFRPSLGIQGDLEMLEPDLENSNKLYDLIYRIYRNTKR